MNSTVIYTVVTLPNLYFNQEPSFEIDNIFLNYQTAVLNIYSSDISREQNIKTIIYQQKKNVCAPILDFLANDNTIYLIVNDENLGSLVPRPSLLYSLYEAVITCCLF